MQPSDAPKPADDGANDGLPPYALAPVARPEVPWVDRSRRRKRRDPLAGWQVAWRSLDGAWHQIDVTHADELDLAHLAPVREPSVHRQRSTVCGWINFQTADRWLPYESALERDILLLLDFEPGVRDCVTQPLYWRDADSTSALAPDALIRRPDGTKSVVEVKRAATLDDPIVAARLERGQRLAALAGWDHEIRTEPNATLLRNVRLVRGARQAVVDHDWAAELLRRAGRDGCSMGVLLRGANPAIRALAFRLIAERRLACDLTETLSSSTWVHAAPTS